MWSGSGTIGRLVLLEYTVLLMGFHSPVLLLLTGSLLLKGLAKLKAEAACGYPSSLDFTHAQLVAPRLAHPSS